ncbi:MAG: DUF4340 domain-containing protein [Faecalibacterium sp.]
MKKKQTTLFLLLALVVAAGGALALLDWKNEQAEQAASAAAQGSIPLSAFASGELTRIVLTYAGETLTLDCADGAWTLAEDPEYHLDSSACNTMVTALSALNAKRALSPESGEDYGLAEPVVTVTATAAGESSTFSFGAKNDVTGDVYVQKMGDSAVYTVSGAKRSCFEMTKAELFGAFNPAGLVSSALEAVSYTLGDGTSICLAAVSEPVESEDADSDPAEYQTVWRLSGDPKADVDETAVQALLSALSSYVTEQVTGADPEKYGLDAPDVTVQAQTAQGVQTLCYAVGADGCWMMVEGDASVYRVDSTLLDAFLPAEENWKTTG